MDVLAIFMDDMDVFRCLSMCMHGLDVYACLLTFMQVYGWLCV